ncbi:hypothetical protein Tco_1442047, partial [Tanacetum coccineum]
PTHSAFIRAASSGSKLNYSNQQSIVPSISQTSGRSDSIMECVLHSFVAENEPDQDMIYEDFDSKLNYSNQQSIVPSVSQTSGRSNSIMECVLHSFVAENEQDQDMIYEDFDQGDPSTDNDIGGYLSFLLDALFLLVAMDYAADSVYLLVGILLLVDSFLLIGFVYAANTSIHAAGLVCAGSIMFLLADLFLLVVSIPAGVIMERGSEDFTDILSYLDHSPLRYALTHDPPVVFDSLVKQFWATATVRPNAAGSHDLVATIDGREVVVTESLIRAQLQLDDANGIFDMPIDDILEGMGVIGYPTGRTLTFLKHHLSPQWRFLVHTIMHCLSPKAGSWNQFPSSIATALICLSTGRVYNFSRFILEGMIANVKTTKNKFLMYPRFLQMLVAIETVVRTPRPTFGFTRKLFSNMKFKWEGEEIPLTPPMLAIAAANEDNAAADEAAGSAAEAHHVPHSPLVSPVRELTPERQSASERPPSLSPTPQLRLLALRSP